MNKVLFTIPVLLFAFGINYAYSEPLDEVSVTILEKGKDTVTVQIIWNHDETITKYKIGCVSCTPNIAEFTSEDNIILDKITTFPNTSKAMLYLIAYDLQDEIIDARQFIIDITQ